MSQHIHEKYENEMQPVIDWMESLVAEKKEDDTPIHQIQHFQIIPQDMGTSISYTCIVVCNHNKE